MGSAKKTKGKRPKSTRPVLQFRVSTELYERLGRVADRAGVTIAEVASRWVEDFDATIKAGEQARKILQDADDLMQKNTDAFLRSRNYTHLSLDTGHVWASRDAVAAGKLSMSVDAAAIIEAMKPDLIRALVSSLDKQKGKPK